MAPNAGCRIANPAFRVFLALCSCAEFRVPRRSRLRARVPYFPAAHSVLRPCAVFHARGPADRSVWLPVWYNGGRAAKIDAGRVWREFTRPRPAWHALLWTRPRNETATINAAFTAETFRIKL